MGRSVSYAKGSIVRAYNYLEDNEFAYGDAKEDLIQYAPTLWPSLRPCEKWLGREDLAALENDLVYIGLSEYCGMVCFWIVPKEERRALGKAWAENVATKFNHTFGNCVKVGTFSNGESIYQRKVV